MTKSNELSRRSFIRKTAVAGAAGAAVPYFVSAKALGRAGNVGANDKIQLGPVLNLNSIVITCWNAFQCF